MNPIMLRPIPLHTPQDEFDCRFTRQSDPAEFRTFGQRLNAGSVVLMNLVEQGVYPEWLIALAKKWATVDDGTLLKALMEEWSPEDIKKHFDEEG